VVKQPASAAAAAPGPIGIDVAAVQRRTLRLLFVVQVVGGVGVAVGIAVGALLVAAIAGTGASGLAASAAVIGAAVIAAPMTTIIRRRGRRAGLVFCYLCGVLGAGVVVLGAGRREPALMFLGMFLFGGGTAANLQGRYVAVDLATPARRGRQLSLIVWATTLGAVAGPNLAPLADRAVQRFGLPEYSGPFVFSALAFGGAGAAVWLLMRPDPLLTARALAGGADPLRRTGLPVALRAVAADPAARLGVAAVAAGHLVMVGVMSMTPVHIGDYVHVHGDVLKVVGLVLSLHIAGMYGLAPVIGALADRYGRREVILGGVVTLLGACAVAGTAGTHTGRLSVGLALLGIGWSGTMVGGSTLLSESVPVALRPAAQGLSDMVMGLAGAVAGAVSGVVVDLSGYPTLALLAALAAVPLAGLALRRPHRAVG
jgi:MFS family permease